MKDCVYIRIKGEVSICVPADVHLFTHFVLREQEDWFEDEIEFIRGFVQPGMNIIDIGANYGVYTLTAAHLAGESGRVWAFEPSSSTARLLRKSLVKNKLNNVDLIHAGLSEARGFSSLMLDANTEMCFLDDGVDENANSERVELFSLDDCMIKYGWADIDFIKMDAEGHESKVIKGGTQLLANASPLIMYEIKAGDKVNLDLRRDFKQLGYESYVLVPGQNVLVPFDAGDVDGYLLNLFCCKEDCAKRLEDEGRLVRQWNEVSLESMDSSTWVRYVEKFEYAHGLLSVWLASPRAQENEDNGVVYKEALSLYAVFSDDLHSASIRYASLRKSYEMLIELYACNSSVPRALSLIRVARDLGKRAHAVRLLRELLERFNNNQPIKLDEPFLPVSVTMETVRPVDSGGRWLLSSVFETFEKLRSFSAYYNGVRSLEMLELIKSLGYQTPEMERRRQLVRLCAGKSSEPESCSLLAQAADNNLNPDYWCATE